MSTRFVIHWPVVATCRDCGAHYRIDVEHTARRQHELAFGHRRWNGARVFPWNLLRDTPFVAPVIAQPSPVLIVQP